MCSLAIQTKYDPFVPGVCCAGSINVTAHSASCSIIVRHMQDDNLVCDLQANQNLIWGPRDVID